MEMPKVDKCPHWVGWCEGRNIVCKMPEPPLWKVPSKKGTITQQPNAGLHQPNSGLHQSAQPSSDTGLPPSPQLPHITSEGPETWSLCQVSTIWAEASRWLPSSSGTSSFSREGKETPLPSDLTLWRADTPAFHLLRIPKTVRASMCLEAKMAASPARFHLTFSPWHEVFFYNVIFYKFLGTD